MVAADDRKKRWRTALAVMLGRLGRSPELTKLLLLLLVWGHVRSRPGYTIMEQKTLPKPNQLNAVPKGKGFSVKRPRQRFL